MTPVVGGVSAEYHCPACKTKKKVILAYVDQGSLSSKKQEFQYTTWCTRCHIPHSLKYTLKRDKKIKLVEFTSSGKNYLNRVKKDFKVEGN
jgi:hypothetical protein